MICTFYGQTDNNNSNYKSNYKSTTLTLVKRFYLLMLVLENIFSSPCVVSSLAIVDVSAWLRPAGVYILPRTIHTSYGNAVVIVITVILSCACIIQIREITRYNKKDTYLAQDLPCIVSLSWIHNHGIKTAQALSYRDASQELQDCFISYFNEGMTPSAALKYHTDCLEMANDFTEESLADASKNPLAFSVYRWHDSWRKRNLGESILNHLSEHKNLYHHVSVVILWL